MVQCNTIAVVAVVDDNDNDNDDAIQNNDSDNQYNELCKDNEEKEENKKHNSVTSSWQHYGWHTYNINNSDGGKRMWLWQWWIRRRLKTGNTDD